MSDRTDTDTATDPTSSFVETLQRAWDEVGTLPPLVFTDTEAVALRDAFAPDPCKSGQGATSGVPADQFHAFAVAMLGEVEKAGGDMMAALHVASQAGYDATQTRKAELVAVLELAQPIVEADHDAAKESGDSDWEGMAYTALEAVNAALNARGGA